MFWSWYPVRGVLLVMAVPLWALVAAPVRDSVFVREVASGSLLASPAQPDGEPAPAAQVTAAEPSEAGFSARGRVRTGFVVGLGNTLNNTYLILAGADLYGYRRGLGEIQRLRRGPLQC